MESFLYYIIPFSLVLGILISFHEFGHFLLAKFFNVKVLKFSLGFGPKLIGKQIGETEYLISAFPLGGYVKMVGESDDDEVTPDDAQRSFSAQSPFKRIVIAAAGPAFNFILAFLLLSGVYMFSGYPMLIPEVGQVRQDSPAEKAGILKGDIIKSIEGQEIEQWDEIKKIVENNPDRGLTLVILRDGELMTTTVYPENEIVKNIFGEEVKSALIGIVASGMVKTAPVSPFRAIIEAAKKTWEVTVLTILTIVKLFQGVVSFKTLGGPIMIGQLTGEIAKESLISLLPFTAVISVNLAILNLLPVPILDGGMIIFCLIEILIKKPLSLRKRELAQKIGFFLLILLMVFVFYNDLIRIVSG